MDKKIIRTENAPAPIGPYNQAVQFGNMLFISGQIALDPKDGSLYQGGDIKVETEKVMQNLKAILFNAGMDFSNVLKSTIFLMDMGQFAQVNEVYGTYFQEATAPARETVQVAGLPKGVQVEISMIAAKESAEDLGAAMLRNVEDLNQQELNRMAELD
jgi:2-iminobutanoate/2-iminopropanoate deaminase